ncbi:MAG: type ISP restriction/modification enzyme [Polyangiales bacterium]
MSGLTPAESASLDAASRRDGEISGSRRRTHGVVHTPVALCRYVVQRLHLRLQSAGLPKGLRTPRLTVIDPACGTGAFFASLLRFVDDPKHLTLRGIDLDPAALSSARAALGRPAGVHLDWIHADALALPHLAEVDGPLAIIGNPPWASRTASKVSASEAHLEAFRRDVNGVRLEERKLGVLSDSYVRFFAWAHAAFEHRPGAFAFVSNASFLDGPVHRGMRGALLRRFPSIELTDLGGSSLVARARGVEDDNVFGVRPGVVVAVGARPMHAVKAQVTYARVLGTKDDKLRSLAEAEPSFSALPSLPPSHLFVPTEGAEFPAHWQSIDTLIPFHREGVQTNRDAVLVDASRETLLSRMQSFAMGLRLPLLEVLEKKSAHYDPEAARRLVLAALNDDPAGTTWIRPIEYRPYDTRYFVSLSKVCHRPRAALQRAIDASSFSLVTVRKDRGGRPWNHVFATTTIIDNCLLSARSSCRARAFPTHGPGGDANLSELGRRWAKDISGDESPEALLEYAFAWWLSPTYQRHFAGVLRHDYPRLPPPGKNAKSQREAGKRALETMLKRERMESAGFVGHWNVTGPTEMHAAEALCDDHVNASNQGLFSS